MCRVTPDVMDKMVVPVKMVLMARTVDQVSLVMLDHRVKRDLMDPLDIPVSLEAK